MCKQKCKNCRCNEDGDEFIPFDEEAFKVAMKKIHSLRDNNSQDETSLEG